MTALFVAQMSWWIIFQITHVPGDIQALERSLEYQRYEAVERWRNWSDLLADSLGSSWSSLTEGHVLDSRLAGLPAWSSIVLEGSTVHRVIPGPSAGVTIGSINVPIIANQATVYFSAEAASGWLADQFPSVRYHPIADSTRTLRDALTAEQLTINPATVEKVLQGRRHRTRMFVSEGSFFLLLILLGALSIHRALRQSAQLERQQQNFLAAVTHELKSPLASIRLFSETVSARELSDAKRREFMEKITEDVIRLEEMVDDVLEAATLSRETYHAQLVATDLSAALQSYADLYRSRAERAGMRWDTSIAPAVRARIEYRHLRRAIGAVLDNAIKYSQGVPGDKSVRVSLAADGSDAVITVADQGVGLSPSDQRHVFDRFFRAGDELTRRVAGSGLGLFLAREIIAAHDGQITLRSEGPGQGTLVEIRLPLLTSEETQV
jgi:signal transduction histidine kinase